MTSPIESLPIEYQANPFLTPLPNGFEYFQEYFTSALIILCSFWSYTESFFPDNQQPNK